MLEHSATRQVVQRIQSRKASDVILLKGETDSLAQAYDHAIIVTSPEPSTHLLDSSTSSPSLQLPSGSSNHHTDPPLQSVTLPGNASSQSHTVSAAANSLEHPQTILTQAGRRSVTVTLSGVRSQPESSLDSSTSSPSLQLPSGSSNHLTDPPLQSVTLPGNANSHSRTVSVTANTLKPTQTTLNRTRGRSVNVTLGGLRESADHSRNAGSFKLKVNH